jgi:NitT/TauT family transport system substrate-binding protein
MKRRTFLKSAVAATVIAPFTYIPARAARDKWRHVTLTSKGDAGFFYMAQEKGFWDKLGIDVEIIELSGSKELLRAMIAGEAQTADNTPSDLIPLWLKNVDIRVVAGTIVGHSYAMYTRKDITEWSQLADKTFGVSGEGSAPHMFALAMLKTAGVPTDKIKIANTGGSAARVKAIVAGATDATCSNSEFSLKLGDAVHVLGYAKDMAPMFPRLILPIMGDTIKNSPEACAKFTAGYLQGLRYCVDHRDEELALAAKINKVEATDPSIAFAYDDIVKNNMIAMNLEIPTDKIKWMADLMLQVKVIDAIPDIAKYMDTSVQQAALKLVQA